MATARSDTSRPGHTIYGRKSAGGKIAVGKIAFLCPGYGSQTVGMGVDFMGRYQWGADFFEDAKATTGLDIFDLCMSGPDEELSQTQNGQPCMVVTSIAIARALKERGIEPDCVAGMFEGEYAAHVIAHTIDVDSALELVARRGALMAMAAHVNKGGMVLLEGCDARKAQELCEQFGGAEGETLAVAAYLDDETTAVSGSDEALQKAADAWKESSGREAINLAGGVAANCRLMSSAKMGMRMALKNTLFGPGEIPVYNNLDGKRFDHMRSPEILGEQITSPVMWAASIEQMIEDGVDTFVQCGPGSLALDTAQRIAAKRKVKATFVKAATAEDVMFARI